jgi:hypothetical protein
MNRLKIFQALRSGQLAALVALVGLGLLFTASGVKAAGCAGVPYKAAAAASAPFVSPQAQADDESLNRQESEDSNRPASIVGLWHLIYTGNTDNNFPPGGPFPPTPFQFAETFKMWHGDGTEWENAVLPPSGGNMCFGVWKDLGHRTVKLHHVGLMFGPDGSLVATFTVDEIDKVSADGKTYSGTFDFRLWGPSFSAIGVGAPISEVTGTTAATRITVD